MSMMSNDFINWLKKRKEQTVSTENSEEMKDIQSAMKLLEYYDKHIKYPDVSEMTLQEVVDCLNSTDPMTLSIDDLDEEIRRAESMGADAFSYAMQVLTRSDYLNGVRYARATLLNAVPEVAKNGVAKPT